MNRHAVKQPAAIAGSPRDTRTRRQAAPHESGTGPGAWALPGTAATRILEELDEVVRKSHRSSALRRMLERMGSAFARLWSRMAPEMPPPQSDLPPERFPWFFL
jgi:urease accessory protein UreF